MLTAPHGTVDAGAAGIRVAGNLNIVALQVQGTSFGLPTVQGPPVDALTTANNVAGLIQQVALPTQSNNDRPYVIIVEVLGYGGGGGDSDAPNQDNRSRGVTIAAARVMIPAARFRSSATGP